LHKIFIFLVQRDLLNRVTSSHAMSLLGMLRIELQCSHAETTLRTYAAAFQAQSNGVRHDTVAEGVVFTCKHWEGSYLNIWYCNEMAIQY